MTALTQYLITRVAPQVSNGEKELVRGIKFLFSFCRKEEFRSQDTAGLPSPAGAPRGRASAGR